MSRRIERGMVGFNTHVIRQQRMELKKKPGAQPLIPETMEFVRREAMDAFLSSLAKIKDPITGENQYSIADLAKIFKLDEGAIKDKLKKNDEENGRRKPPYSSDPPLTQRKNEKTMGEETTEREKAALQTTSIEPESSPQDPRSLAKSTEGTKEPSVAEPEEEFEDEEIMNAYVIGFALGDFHVKDMPANSRVLITSWSKDEGRMEIMRETIGPLGNAHERYRNATGIFLDKERFNFILNPLREREEIDKILKSRGLFAPFLLGLLFTKLTPKEHSISVKDTVSLMLRVKSAYRKHFGESIGDSKQVKSPRGDTREVLYLTNPARTFSTLLTHPSVQQLPFFDKLKEMSFFKTRHVSPDFI